MAQPPKALEQEWYQRLESEGFHDIEDTRAKDRPLKDWHSFRFPSEQTHARRQRNSEYQLRIERFFRESSFEEICTLLVRHGNCKIAVQEVRQIIELHMDGLPERQIAQEIKRSKTCIHKVIRRMKEWMQLT